MFEPAQSPALGPSRGPEEPPDVRGYSFGVFFEREVAGVEEVDLAVVEVAPVRLGPGRREERVALAPHDEGRGRRSRK